MLSYYLHLASMTAINGLLALAMYLPLSSGVMVLTLGSAMGFGAVAAGTVAGGGGGAGVVMVAVLASALAGGVFMAATSLLVQRMRGFILAITTLAVAELVRVLVENQPLLGGALGYRIEVVSADALWPIATLLLAAFAVLFFDRSPARRVASLVSASPKLAMTHGVSPVRVQAGMMTVGGALAGMAGGLYILNLGIIDPRHFGFEGGIQIVTFGVVGGTRSATGPLFAAALLTLIPEMLRLTAEYRMLLYGTALVAMMILRPDGVWRWRRPASEARHLAGTPGAGA